MTNSGVREGAGWVPGIAPPSHPHIPYPGYTPPLPTCRYGYTLPGHNGQVNMVVGLISVGQLTLWPVFSVFWTMTEVYNLSKIDRIINHFLIPGTK